MKEFIMCLIAIIMVLGTLTGCGSKEVKVTCTMCNGSGEIKYYYGEGDNDYDMGLCTSCDEKGYIMVVPKGLQSRKESSLRKLRDLCG